jgi:hypothetical protein
MSLYCGISITRAYLPRSLRSASPEYTYVRSTLILLYYLHRMIEGDKSGKSHNTHLHGLRQVKGKVIPIHAMEAFGGERRYSSNSFLTWTLDGDEWSASRPGRVLPTHCTGGWVGLRAGLDAEARGKILCLCRGSNPGRPVCSQSLYWLSYTAWGKLQEICQVSQPLTEIQTEYLQNFLTKQVSKTKELPLLFVTRGHVEPIRMSAGYRLSWGVGILPSLWTQMLEYTKTAPSEILQNSWSSYFIFDAI